MSGLRIKFTGFKDHGTHTEYSIQIDDLNTGQSCLVSCRYSYLRSLYTSLKKFSPTIIFPGKKLFGNKNLTFLEKRKKDLEAYFSQAFKNPQLVKVLQDLKFFQFHRAESGVCENKKLEVSYCKDCTSDKCWSIVNQIGERFVNLSCHPGCMDEYEALDQQQVILEKCKDLKIQVEQKKWVETIPEDFEGKVDETRWISKILGTCTFNLNQYACKLNG
ncbi:hypothetical protein SteCoe_21577 [Stentor coeruleus]|uniref:PX domain-containing protein n=1 Tax=Stentor coeruleus TaxID=5963 RepID=A0A1R2BPD1_9CILI|nr:hypothetical protein SteCoe_21577 [Stentor coeruleus]